MKPLLVWKDFEIRPVIYITGKLDKDKYDIVKWEEHEPFEAIDYKTGKKVIMKRSCFSIGFLNWDNKEESFNFESCGLRYLEHHIDGLDKVILDFANKEQDKRLKERD